MSGKRKTYRSKSRKSRKLPLAIGLLAVIIVVISVVYVFGLNNTSSPSSSPNPSTGDKVLLQTSMGDITIQLRDDLLKKDLRPALIFMKYNRQLMFSKK